MQNYEHDTLQDPANQIRLLEVHPAEKHDPLAVTISTHRRNLAPPDYASLSYTWGDGQLSRRIQANGAVLDVTKNCWYALGQLRLHATHRYYWIDSICINQNDAAEKSAQVNSMGDTYRSASCVLVSLGPHSKESYLLFSKILKQGMRSRGSQSGEDIVIEPWLQNMRPEDVEKMLLALKSLSSQPYWSRLWTVQEFAHPPKVVVMCGNGRVAWDDLSRLTAMLRKSIKVNRDWYRASMKTLHKESDFNDLAMMRTATIRNTVQTSRHGVAGLAQVVLALGERRCADPRDRIFGLLSLLSWSWRLPALKADYSISRTKLAFRALQHCERKYDFAMASELIAMLEILPDDPEMMFLAVNQPQMEILGVPPAPPVGAQPPTFLRCERLTTLLDLEPSTRPDFVWARLPCEDFEGFATLVPPQREPVPVLVCATAETGDIIIQLDNLIRRPPVLIEGYRSSSTDKVASTFDSTALVLRQHIPLTASESLNRRGEIYQIVGHAILPHGLTLRTPLFPNEDGIVEFDLHIDPEDLLLWAWQAHTRGSRDLDDVELAADYERFGNRFCRQTFSSYAVAQRISEETSLRHTIASAAAQTQNAAQVRQLLATRRLDR